MVYRYSVRAYEKKNVPRELLYQIFDYARFAACSKNMQPWKVIAVSGQVLEDLSADLVQALKEGLESTAPRSSSDKIPDEYWHRARECGYSLFQHKGIARDDKQARFRHFAENYRFFGAPLELFFLCHEKMPQRQMLDLGIFLERVMAKADSLGLASCPQASVSFYPQILAKHLPIEEGMEVICGLALGYEDKSASVNAFRTAKLEVDEIVTWLD